MNIVGKLMTVELIKIRKRTVFWVAIVIHATIIGIRFGGQQYTHHVKAAIPAFSLPGDWLELILTGAQLGMLMLFIGIALLIASENTWRTQRQNVIDGLSRGQYFCGKIFVVLLLATILWVNISLMGIVLAAFGGHGALAMPVFSKLSGQMLPNVLLYFLGIGFTAFMLGMLASSSGAALGLLFAFLIVSPILTAILGSMDGAWPVISRYLPLEVFGNLISRGSYDPEALARMTAIMTKLGRPLPLALHTSIIATAAYIVAFVAFTWLVFRSRDL